eukprot:gene3970-14052_t
MSSNMNAVASNPLGVQKVICKDRVANKTPVLAVTSAGSGSDQPASSGVMVENDAVELQHGRNTLSVLLPAPNRGDDVLRRDSDGEKSSSRGCEGTGNPADSKMEGLELSNTCAKEKNRQAQRRFRERQKTLVDALKERMVALVAQVSERDAQIEKLREENKNMELRLIAASAAPGPMNNQLAPMMLNAGNNVSNRHTQQHMGLLQLLAQSADQRFAAQNPVGQMISGQRGVSPVMGMMGMQNLNCLPVPAAPGSSMPPIQASNQTGQSSVFLTGAANLPGIPQMGSSGMSVDQQLMQLQSGMFGQLGGKLLHVLPSGF